MLQLEREAALREAALAAAGEEAASLQEAARAAQMAANQYLLDLQVKGPRGGSCQSLGKGRSCR